MSKLVVVCGWRYEPEWMVEQLKENLKWVDDFVIMDDRKRKELWGHEGNYRLRGREAARKLKADWILITSPDERWEKEAGNVIRPLIDDNKNKIIYEFNLKELFHPMWYRIDAGWGEKSRRRLYPLYDDQIMRYQPIQCPSMPTNEGYEVKHIDVNIYHTKMIEPENRNLRARVFNATDPTSKYQGVGYDYLDDEKEALVQRIPEGREYYPKYKKFLFKVPEEYFPKPELVEETNVETIQ